MRAAALALLAALVVPAWAAQPETVTYLLGGVVSGPYRVSADLAAGVIAEAKPPLGARGDGAGVNAATMPETRSRPLPPGAAARIRALAVAVLQEGAARRGCLPVMDALVRFSIALPAGTRDLDASAPCLTPDAKRLQAALLCAMTPGTTTPGTTTSGTTAPGAGCPAE